jgi:putative peptide zinc metalloprotease protein
MNSSLFESFQSPLDRHPDAVHWQCPNLTSYWQLGQIRDSEQVVLQAIEGQQQYQFTATEGFALRYFTGSFTLAQVQAQCEQQFGATVPPQFVQKIQRSPSFKIRSPPSSNLVCIGYKPAKATGSCVTQKT